MELPKRKKIRLKEYDYSNSGAYFITMCVDNREQIFGTVILHDKTDNLSVGARIARPSDISCVLTSYGEIVDYAIRNITVHYPTAYVDVYSIMPNHVHMIMMLRDNDSGRAVRAPTVSTIINQLKGYITKQIGFPLWQKSFYEHIIRNEFDLFQIRKYITENPVNWLSDEYYIR